MATRKGLSFKVGICRAQLPPGRLTFIKKYDIISKKGLLPGRLLDFYKKIWYY